jgi:putative NIF3 family GTP cyclohydrolase 1 type 2
MKLKDIIKIIETEFSPQLAYEWDNPGLFYGNIDSDIKKVLVT